MRVFTSFNKTLPAATDNASEQRGRADGPSKVKKSYRPPRENLSAEEIKSRVASKTQASKAKKIENLTGKQTSTFMADTPDVKADLRTKPTTSNAVKGLGNPEEVEKKVGQTEEKKVLLHSDVDKNDPNDTNVQEKLRGLLGSGGFGWNEKERAALSEILGKN